MDSKIIREKIGDSPSLGYGLLVDRCPVEFVWGSLSIDFLDYEVEQEETIPQAGLVAAVNERGEVYLGGIGVSSSCPETAIVFRLTLEGKIHSKRLDRENFVPREGFAPLVERLRDRWMSREKKSLVYSLKECSNRRKKMVKLPVYVLYHYDSEGRRNPLGIWEDSSVFSHLTTNYRKVEKETFYKLEEKWFSVGQVKKKFDTYVEGLVEVKDDDILDQLEFLHLKRANEFVND